MTGIAVTGTVGIVSPAAAGKGCSGMTGGAIQAGGNMVGILAGRRDTVTRRAVVDDTGMVKGGRDKAAWGMADPAILGGFDMIDFFGRGETGIVTGCAVIDNTVMAEGSRLESGSLVAVDTIAVGWHVVVILARGGNTIVAEYAVVHDALVFKTRIGEGRGGVAQRAIVGDGDVRRIDLGRGAGCIDAVVAGSAVIDDPGMIEYRRCEGATGYVADPAILGRGDVIGLGNLAGCIDAVVAGIAAYGEYGRIAVIDERVGKIGCVMT